MQMPSTRAEAISQGLTQYFTGKPCPKGHVAPRFTKGSACLECNKDRSKTSRAKELRKEYDAATREERLKVRREYHKRVYAERTREKRLAMLEKAREQGRARYWLDPDRWREATREYKAKNPEKAKAWRHENPERLRAAHHRRRSRIRGAEGSFTAADVVAITKAQKGKCACCGQKTKLTVDHIIPLARGGSNWPSNLQMLCLSCNTSKHSRDPIEFMQSRGALL